MELQSKGAIRLVKSDGFEYHYLPEPRNPGRWVVFRFEVKTGEQKGTWSITDFELIQEIFEHANTFATKAI